MDDVNNMDESMDTVEDRRSGVSRRDMIKASVVAGGLIWSAPILLTGTAAAAPGDLCCSNGTPVSFKIPSGSTAQCISGSSCLDSFTPTPPAVVFPCPSGLVQCLVGLGFVQSRFQGNMQATVTLSQGITLIAIGVKAASACYYSICPCFPTSTGTCPSLCTSSGGNCNNTCQGSQCTTSPPNAITVDVVGSTTTININTSNPPAGGGNGHNIETIHLSICVPHAVTGMCPH